MENVLMTLHQFLLSWLTDETFREENPDLKQAMEDHGLGDVTGEDVHEGMKLVSDELSPYQAQQMSPYLNAPSGAYNEGSNFNIDQGGSASAAGSGAQAASGLGYNESYGGGTAGQYIMPDHYGDTPLDDAVREVQFITNNFSTTTETNTTNIDDRDTAVDNSVRQVIDTGGGDLDQEFTSSVVSGDVTGDGNAVGTGNTAQSGDGSAFGDGAAVQSGDGNVAGDNNQVGEGNQAGDGSAFGQGSQVNAIDAIHGEGTVQISGGTGNTSAFDGDAESTGNITGGDDVNAVGNQSISGDNSENFVDDSQFAGDDLEGDYVDNENADFSEIDAVDSTVEVQF